DIDAITGILGDNAFLFGDKPTAADMSVGPMLRAISKSPVLLETGTYVAENQALMAYSARVAQAFYPEPV
ncbi:MAG: glutathione S-transferase C-terminal domain-containing protein, partial [Halocynthiibacter sp.]